MEEEALIGGSELAGCGVVVVSPLSPHTTKKRFQMVLRHLVRQQILQNFRGHKGIEKGSDTSNANDEANKPSFFSVHLSLVAHLHPSAP